MNSKRVFFLMCGTLSLSLILIVGAVVFGDQLLKKKSSNLMSLKLENQVLDEQQTALAQANKDVQKFAELEKIAKSIVPQDKDQARAVREIMTYANNRHITIANISFPNSTLGATKPAQTSTTSSATAQTPSITQVKPVDGLPGVYQMEINIKSESTAPVPYSALIGFLSDLEKNRRTSQVSSINITPDTKNINLLSFDLTINVFIRP